MTSAGGNREGVGGWGVMRKTGQKENPDVAQEKGEGGEGRFHFNEASAEERG